MQMNKKAKTRITIMGIFLLFLGVFFYIYILPLVSATAVDISTCQVISSPGTYNLNTDILNSDAEVCINITSDNVILNGNNYKIDGVMDADTPNPSKSKYAIYSTGLNTKIKNCEITNWQTGIYLDEGANNSEIFKNNIKNLYGVRGAAETGDSGGDDFGIYINSNENVVYNNTILNLTGGFSDIQSGSDLIHGGNSTGIYLSSSINNNLTLNIISNLIGGEGGQGVQSDGGDGGISLGIYLFSSMNNNLTLNVVSNLTGGDGGEGFADGSVPANGGDGGISSGICLFSSMNNNLTLNVVSNLTGGDGGDVGGEVGDGGDGGISYSFYLNQSNFLIIKNNKMEIVDWGFYFNDIENCSIYNNLINSTNTIKFAGNIYNNDWNTTKQFGGNYWTNPTQTGYSDNCSDLNFDGFCDNSYSLNTSNIDYLPLAFDAAALSIDFTTGTEDDNAIKPQDYVFVNVSVTEDNEDTITFNLFNDDYSLNKTQSYTDKTHYYNFTGLSDNIFYYKVWMNDTSNNKGSTETRKITLDATSPLISYTTGTEDDNAIKPQDYVFVNVSVTEDNEDTITFNLYNSDYSLNDSKSYINKTHYYNFTNLNSGVYYYNVTINDTYGNENQTETRKITLDTTPPTINIQSPKSQNYYYHNIDLKYTSTDLNNISSCWYKVINSTGNVEKNNITLTNCNNITFNLTSQNTYTLYLYSNDTFGNINVENITFGTTIDSPIIVLDYPTDNEFFNYLNNIYFNFTVSDSDGIDECQLWLNNTNDWTKNYTWDNITSGIQNFTILNLTEQSHNWNIWCNDSLGIGAWAFNNQTFTNDITNPNVIINSITTTAGSLSCSFISNETDTNLNSCWFTLYNNLGNPEFGYENKTFNCNENTDFLVSNYGVHSLKLYANDSAGNIASSSLFNFEVKEAPPAPPSGGGGGTTIIVGDDTVKWQMTTESGGSNYQISMFQGIARTKNIAFENLGESSVQITMSCEDVENSDFCKYIEFEKDSFELPLAKDIKTLNKVIINPPEVIKKGTYYFNVVATDENKNRGLVTFKIDFESGNIIIKIATKLGSKKQFGDLFIPYILIWVFISLISYFIIKYGITKPNKLPEVIAVIGGLLIGLGGVYFI